jgi:aryl-alcohol dehydrogenase-like predicted oxidoreductase
MSDRLVSRREFIKGAAASGGVALASTYGAERVAWGGRKTAADQVALGKTGLKLSRLGIGTGTNSGELLRGLGHERFNHLIHYAYERGITYIDTADAYQTHPWVREAIRGLPREKLYIQSKAMYMPGFGRPEKPLEMVDRFRKELNVDYIDTVLIHCQIPPNWDEQNKPLRDALEEAKHKGMIRAHGVSTHSLPATTKAASLDWVDVNLVRINPQGVKIDTPKLIVYDKSNESDVPAVVEQLKIMRENGHGIIGMKLIGDGAFTHIEDRKRSLTWAMKSGIVDAVVIGMKNKAEIDEAILHINNAFAG